MRRLDREEDLPTMRRLDRQEDLPAMRRLDRQEDLPAMRRLDRQEDWLSPCWCEDEPADAQMSSISWGGGRERAFSLGGGGGGGLQFGAAGGQLLFLQRASPAAVVSDSRGTASGMATGSLVGVMGGKQMRRFCWNRTQEED
jgi:hypothetical protein